MTSTIAPSEVSSIAGRLLQSATSTASSLLEKVRRSSGTLSERPIAPLPAPTSFTLSQVQRSALMALASADPEALPKIPHVRRVLKTDELRSYIQLLEKIKNAKKGIERLDGHAKQVLHNHFDVTLENNGAVTADTPFHPKSGWYAVEDKVSGEVPGASQKVTREVSGGGITLTVEDLKSLRDQGAITSEDFLRFTRPVTTRVVDDTAIIAAIAEQPSFAEKLINVAVPVAPTPSITLRPTS
jgi:hypothetical protein